jgi:hypothetical protein
MKIIALARPAALLLLLSAASCAGEANVVPVPAASPVGAARHRSLTPTAPALFAEIALTSLRIDARRRDAIDAIETRLEDALAAELAARAELLNVIADGLEAGRIDERAVATCVDRVAAEMHAAGAALASALDDLHALLRPDERARVASIAAERWRAWHARWASLDDDADQNALSGSDDRLRRELSVRFPGDAFRASAQSVAADAAEDARDSAERTARAAIARIRTLAPSERVELALRLRERAAALR